MFCELTVVIQSRRILFRPQVQSYCNSPPHGFLIGTLRILVRTISISFLLFLSLPCEAQEKKAQDSYLVKARLIGTLAGYIYWPKTSPAFDKTRPLTIVVIGDNPFERRLDEVYKNGQILNKPIQIKYSKKYSSLLECDILFVCESESRKLDEILSLLKGRPVLTIADFPDSAKRGVMVNFYEENSRTKIEVNISALRKNGLEMESHVLRLARIVG